MILSNTAIVEAIKEGRLRIGSLDGTHDAGSQPFNTTAVDLHLGNDITALRAAPAAFDLRSRGISKYLADNSDRYAITPAQPFCLGPATLVLASTRERVEFPIIPGRPALVSTVLFQAWIAANAARSPNSNLHPNENNHH